MNDLFVHVYKYFKIKLFSFLNANFSIINSIFLYILIRIIKLIILHAIVKLKQYLKKKN